MGWQRCSRRCRLRGARGRGRRLLLEAREAQRDAGPLDGVAEGVEALADDAVDAGLFVEVLDEGVDLDGDGVEVLAELPVLGQISWMVTGPLSRRTMMSAAAETTAAAAATTAAGATQPGDHRTTTPRAMRTSWANGCTDSATDSTATGSLDTFPSKSVRVTMAIA